MAINIDLTLRQTGDNPKRTPLSNAEVDANFTNLKDGIVDVDSRLIAIQNKLDGGSGGDDSVSGLATRGELANGLAQEANVRASADTALQNSKLNKDGSQAMTGILNMGGNRIATLGEPTGISDAATMGYVDTNFVKRNGVNSMTSALFMGIPTSRNQIKELADPSTDYDAATKKYVDGRIQEVLNQSGGEGPTGIADISQISESVLQAIDARTFANNQTGYPSDVVLLSASGTSYYYPDNDQSKTKISLVKDSRGITVLAYDFFNFKRNVFVAFESTPTSPNYSASLSLPTPPTSLPKTPITITNINVFTGEAYQNSGGNYFDGNIIVVPPEGYSIPNSPYINAIFPSGAVVLRPGDSVTLHPVKIFGSNNPAQWMITDFASTTQGMRMREMELNFAAKVDKFGAILQTRGNLDAIVSKTNVGIYEIKFTYYDPNVDISNPFSQKPVILATACNIGFVFPTACVGDYIVQDLYSGIKILKCSIYVNTDSGLIDAPFNLLLSYPSVVK